MLNRRELLVVGAGLAVSQLPNVEGKPIHAGWLEWAAQRRTPHRPVPERIYRQIQGTGESTRTLLWRHFEKVTKNPFEPHVQGIGDCVGQAYGLGVDTLTTVQIDLHGQREEWRAKCSTEAIYGGSRIEIGKGKACFDRRGRPIDGTIGEWAAAYIRNYGVLLRGRYENYDLTKYSAELARKWGSYRVGVPDELEAISKPHPVRTATLVTSWSQACDLIANGYPIILCSNVGFYMRTDAQGFLAKSREPWYHSMLLWGIDTISRRKGGCIANSWGSQWLDGPEHALGTPKGCFWADAEIIDMMLKQGDSYAISNYIGYPRQNLDYRLY